MTTLENLTLGFGRTLPLILQTESSECGLACLAIIAGFHGHRTDLPTLRNRFNTSLKGATLAELITIGNKMDLESRPLKLDLDELSDLRLPCILHWEFNHFVVLKSANSSNVVIHDPACGIKQVSWNEASKSFTGIALELWPTINFEPKVERQKIRLADLMGKVVGVAPSLIQILILALALEALALLSPLFLQLTIDNVLPGLDYDLLTTLAIGFILVLLIQQVLTSVRSWLLLFLGTSMSLQWRTNLLAHLLKLPVQFFEKRHIGDIVSRFGSSDVIQRTLTTSFIECILDGLMAAVTFTLMLLYSPYLAGIAALAMLLYAITRAILYLPLRKATEEQIILSSRSETHFLESIRGIRTIKYFQGADTRKITWATLLVDQTNADLRTQKILLLYKFVNGLLFGAENILIIWLGSVLVMRNEFTVGILTAFLAYKGNFDSRVANLIDKVSELKMLQLQAERLADIALTEPELIESTHAIPNSTKNPPEISFRDVRFRYGDKEPFLLDGVGFTIAPGTSVAIAGASGCGKTTLMKVLVGTFAPTEGEVLIDGLPLKLFGIAALRSITSTVLQEDTLFSGSIADNISFFDSNPDRAWITRCAELASVADEIMQMPMGYQTLIGDMGTILSGGQKQRILLARALYRKPQILILDEATSHLDVTREIEVNQAIGELNITRIIIAHRPQTIESADRVIVLREGRIAYDGTTRTVT